MTSGETTWRHLALLLAGLWLITSAAALRLYLERGSPGEPRSVVTAEPPPDRLVLDSADWDELPGWFADAVGEARPALDSSCDAWSRMDSSRALGAAAITVTVADWRPFCDELERLGEHDVAGLRELMRRRLMPRQVWNGDRRLGLFTGYFEPLLDGSRRRHGRFQVPLYLRPPDLVSVDLGRFRDDLAGRRIAGRLQGDRLEPYPDRAAIDGGALAGRGLELVWVDDAIDAFFLHIQGSGRIRLEEGGTVAVGYAGQNGHPYLAIGRELVERGEMTLEEVSLESLRRWLAEHPDQAAGVMHRNRSYVFFTERRSGPVGALGVELTPGRSLAVDRRFLPLGAPLWLEAMAPASEPGRPDRRVRRLVVAQDTGGAIRGPVRGDLFWGAGEEAESVAGRMRHRGRLWLLLPRDGTQRGQTTSRTTAASAKQ